MPTTPASHKFSRRSTGASSAPAAAVGVEGADDDSVWGKTPPSPSMTAPARSAWWRASPCGVVWCGYVVGCVVVVVSVSCQANITQSRSTRTQTQTPRHTGTKTPYPQALREEVTEALDQVWVALKQRQHPLQHPPRQPRPRRLLLRRPLPLRARRYRRLLRHEVPQHGQERPVDRPGATRMRPVLLLAAPPPPCQLLRRLVVLRPFFSFLLLRLLRPLAPPGRLRVGLEALLHPEHKRARPPEVRAAVAPAEPPPLRGQGERADAAAVAPRLAARPDHDPGAGAVPLVLLGRLLFLLRPLLRPAEQAQAAVL